MSLEIVQALAPSPWRVRVVFNEPIAGHPSLVDAGLWVAARSDGGHTLVEVTHAWAVDTAAVELALGAPLLDGTPYTVAPNAVPSGVTVRWRAPSPDATGAGRAADAEAEAFGVDWDWLAPGLDAAGDIPVVTGRKCLLHDLAAIAVTDAGELFHRPAAGAGMRSKVNGANGTPDALDDTRRALRTAWQADPRVSSATVVVSADGDGTTTATGTLATVALSEELTVSVRGG